MFEKRMQLINSISSLSDEEKEILYSALNIHGHMCGGMPLGFTAGKFALKILNSSRERNMDKLVIMFTGERHAAGCFADGVQFATGCTFGKGIMKKEPKGKKQEITEVGFEEALLAAVREMKVKKIKKLLKGAEVTIKINFKDKK